MVDALQWMLDLMAGDIGRVVAGLLVLITIVELVPRIKEYLQ
jgi:hypothetical protein